MRIIMAGAGAMGSRFGSALYANGCEVILVDSWKEHVEQINRTGLSVTDEIGTRLIPIAAMLPENCDEHADVLILFTKSMQTEEMIRSCLHLITPETMILSLQNGIGNLDILERFVPREQLFAGITTYAADLIGPGNIHAFGSGNIELMHVDGVKRNDAETIVRMFKNAGLGAELSENIMQSIWEKAAFNAVLNPLCTLTLNPVGRIGAYESIMEVISGILNEIEEIAEAENISFHKEKVRSVIEGVFDPKMSAHHYSSMYHDIQKGRQTEIDYLNGAFVQKGKKHDIPMPMNTLLFHLIKMRENKPVFSLT